MTSPIIAGELAFLCMVASGVLCMLAHIGISLREMSQVLRGENENLFTKPINSYGERIGDAIQGQMVRGLRGTDQYDR